ncbi:MAG: Nif3-like dinuclear metal center hexameric protein [Acidobacteria bacterium]|nr:Nif3-like dinuclear metal center hexameric protein [Acidobacteriota bacterium]
MSPMKLLLALVATTGSMAAQSGQALTAAQILDRIREHVGVEWRKETVDTIKSGDPSTHVTGIATTMFATYDVLKRAAAEGKNLVIAHEPTFYSHQDRTESFASANDPVYLEKEKFIKEHNMVVFRFHDHWHMRRPDGVLEGMTKALGWQKYQDASAPSMFRLPESSLELLAAGMRDKLGATTMRVVGERGMKVTKVALSPGAGGSAGHLRILRRSDVEVLAIGEVPEWETIAYVADASAQGRRKALILIGHTPSEQAGMENCAQWLKGFIREVPVGYVAAAEPFWNPRSR